MVDEVTPSEPVDDTALTPAMKAELGITNEELIALKIAVSESKLEDEKDALEIESQDIQTNINKLTDSLREAANEALEEYAEQRVEALQSAFSENFKIQGGKSSIQITPILLQSGKIYDNGNVNFNIVVELYSRTFKSGKQAFDDLHVPCSMKATAAVKDLLSQIEELDAQLKKIQKKLVSVKSRLSRVDRMERVGRAQLCAHTLSQTEKGRKILQAIGLEADVKSIQSITQNLIESSTE